MDKIKLQISDHIAWITLNNPEKLNCLDMKMMEALEKHLLQIKKSLSARVIVISGAGDKAFSTGGNLKDFRALTKFQDVKHWIKYGNEVFNLLETMPVATIAAIKGYAMGGGLELALSCDLRIATDGSVFSMPELQHGWVPGWGGLAKLRRLIGEARAKEMIMLGDRLDGHDALSLGLISKVCTEDDFDNYVNEIAAKLSKIDPFLMEMSKTSIMDHSRTSQSNDLLFDALATSYSKQ